MTYSIDLREKVLSVKEQECLSFQVVADRFQIGVATVFRWSKRIEPKRTREKPPLKISNEALLADIDECPDAYIYERAKRLGVSRSGIQHALKRLKITYKKNISTS